MPQLPKRRIEDKPERERSTRLRPGRVRRTPSSRPRVYRDERNLLRLARLVSRSSSSPKGKGTSSKVDGLFCKPFRFSTSSYCECSLRVFPYSQRLEGPR